MRPFFLESSASQTGDNAVSVFPVNFCKKLCHKVLCDVQYKDLTVYSERSLEDGLGREHRAVNLQNLLLVDEVLPPCLQDVVLQSAADRPEIVQTAHT